MPDQLTLPATIAPSGQDRGYNLEDLKWLEATLKAAGDWRTSTELLTSIGRLSENDRRWLRTLASASEWTISGQLGYKHLEHATLEEINHAANWWESQAKKMADRAQTIRRNSKNKIA